MNEAEFIEISDFMNLLADRSKVITLEGFNSNLTLQVKDCLLYTSPSPRDQRGSRMPSSA